MTDKNFHIFAITVVVLGLVVFLLDISRFSYVRIAVNTANTLIAPVLELKEHLAIELREELRAYLYLVSTERENIRLRRKVSTLILTQKELDACLSELENLQSKVGLSPQPRKLNYSLSRIIYYDPSGLDLFLIIEGGKDKGFREGDIVTTEHYVVGIIESVFASTSRVITPFNERFSVSAIVGSGPKRYIYRGGFPSGSLLHVKINDRIFGGEEVFMVDIKGAVPPFLIGKVGSVKRDGNPFFKSVEVKPIIDPRRERYVYVIRRLN